MKETKLAYLAQSQIVFWKEINKNYYSRFSEQNTLQTQHGDLAVTIIQGFQNKTYCKLTMVTSQ